MRAFCSSLSDVKTNAKKLATSSQIRRIDQDWILYRAGFLACLSDALVSPADFQRVAGDENDESQLITH